MCNSSDFQEDWALDNCALGPNCQQTPREAKNHRFGWFFLVFPNRGWHPAPRLILEIIWHFFLKNHPQNTPKMHCEEVLDRNMWLLASLSSVVLSTQPSHFDTDLWCYLHTEMVFFTWIFSFINHTWRDILHSFSFAKFILKSCFVQVSISSSHLVDG